MISQDGAEVTFEDFRRGDVICYRFDEEEFRHDILSLVNEP
jgi:hypothetical protein